jgi:hypothetical protein
MVFETDIDLAWQLNDGSYLLTPTIGINKHFLALELQSPAKIPG